MVIKGRVVQYHDLAVILLLPVVICDVMYWRFVPIMQHIPCTTGPHYTAACQMSEHHVSRDTGNMTRDTVTSSDPTWWHSPVMGERSMRQVSPEQWGALIKTGWCPASSAYTQLLLIGCCTYSLLTQWVNGNWAIFGFGKVSLSSASLSADARPRISWLMLKPFNFTFSLCDDLRNRLMSV